MVVLTEPGQFTPIDARVVAREDLPQLVGFLGEVRESPQTASWSFWSVRNALRPSRAYSNTPSPLSTIRASRTLLSALTEG